MSDAMPRVKEGLRTRFERDRYLRDPKAFDMDLLGLEVPKFHQEADKALHENKNVMWNAPVGHGKSTKFGFARPVHEIVKNRNIRIILGSKSMQRAMDLLRRIKWELENNRRLIELYGEFKDPEKWSATQIQVLGRDVNLKEPTITITGLHGNIEGVRADIGILDDPIDIEDATSQVERDRGKFWFDNTFLARLEPEARCWVVGTRWHPDDIYDHIAKKPGWANPIHRAILDERKEKVLWPERWSWDLLMKKKAQVGQIAFEARYMNNPQALVGVLFSSEWLLYVDELPTDLLVFQGWDLAISERETADYTVCVTVGVDRENTVYIMDVFRKRMSFPEQTKAVEKLAAIHEPKAIAIESNAYQRAASQHIKRTTMLPVLESPAKGDKVSRIQGMSPHFENGRILLWREAHGIKDFISEFVNFPYGSHDDTLDALWHALQRAIKDKKYGVAKW